MKKGFSDDTFLARWLAGQLKEEEQKNFEERDDYADFNKIIEEVEDLDIPAFSEEHSWQKLLAKKQANPPKKLVRKLKWPIYAAAASIAILLSIGIAIMLGQQTYTTTNGQILAIHLPDASQIQLNVSSTIRYNSFLWRFKRKLALEGEAFFEVEKGNTFSVVVPSGKVSVLGTSFNVWARNQQLEVVCHTGKVSVQSADKSEILQAGEKAIAANGVLDRSSVSSLTKGPSWMEGLSKLEEVSVKRILEELEYQFNIEVAYRGDLQKKLTFSFPHNDLETALRLLSGALQADYEINNNKVVITPNE